MYFIIFIYLISNMFLYGEQNRQTNPEDIKQAKQKAVEINKKMSEKVSQALAMSMPDALYEKYISKPVIKPNLIEPVKSRIYGSKNTKHHIVIFSDFACSHCKVASKELKDRINENKNSVNLTYVFFPLDNSCNPYTEGKLSSYSCVSSKLALCAEKQGKLWKAIDFLYNNQEMGSIEPLLLDMIIKKMEKELAVSKMDECIKSPWVEQRLKKETEVYKSMKIPGTPFILLDNRQLGNVFKVKKSFSDFIKYMDLKENSHRK
ncbi:MAG: thioredoxin domain-containing protein [Proteobacteria bacterium]|nr:thioredoxin domain-containing protein [Pseudomonadota bacterium]